MEGIISTLNQLNLNLRNVSSVTTNEVPVVVGRPEGLVNLMQGEATKFRRNPVMQDQCLIHQESHCAKALKAENVITVLVKAVNFIYSENLSHGYLHDFLNNLDTEVVFITLNSNG